MLAVEVVVGVHGTGRILAGCVLAFGVVVRVHEIGWTFVVVDTVGVGAEGVVFVRRADFEGEDA